MFDFLASGGKNPPVVYKGQCIRGESGNVLVGASIKRPGRRPTLEWRAAPVACSGVALHGGLQTIVQFLAADSLRNQDLTVHVDGSILANADILGALKTTLPGHTFVDLNAVPPRDGNIIIRPVSTLVDNIVKIVAPAPTKTTTFYQVNSQRLHGGDGLYDMEGGQGMLSCRPGQCSVSGGRRKKSKGLKTSRKTKSLKTRKRTRSRKRGGQAESE